MATNNDRDLDAADKYAAQEVSDYESKRQHDIVQRAFLKGCEHARAEMQTSCHKDTPIKLTEAIDPLVINPYRDREGCFEASCFRRGYDAAAEQMQTEIDALKQEVAGGSWAFVKQIEELQAKLAIAVEALEKMIPLASSYRCLKLGHETEEIKEVRAALVKLAESENGENS